MPNLVYILPLWIINHLYLSLFSRKCQSKFSKAARMQKNIEKERSNDWIILHTYIFKVVGSGAPVCFLKFPYRLPRNSRIPVSFELPLATELILIVHTTCYRPLTLQSYECATNDLQQFCMLSDVCFRLISLFL